MLTSSISVDSERYLNAKVAFTQWSVALQVLRDGHDRIKGLTENIYVNVNVQAHPTFIKGYVAVLNKLKADADYILNTSDGFNISCLVGSVLHDSEDVIMENYQILRDSLLFDEKLEDNVKYIFHSCNQHRFNNVKGYNFKVQGKKGLLTIEEIAIMGCKSIHAMLSVIYILTETLMPMLGKFHAGRKSLMEKIIDYQDRALEIENATVES